MDPIILFYEGRGTDRDGRSIDEILQFDHSQLEADHRYIAWLFPVPERSSFGFYTPRLSSEGADELRSRPDLQRKLHLAFRVMLDFYGLELTPGDPATVTEQTTFSHRARAWVVDGNHNFMRISRILRSLSHLGLKDEATSFLTYLEDLATRRPDAIGGRTLAYWRLRASGSGESLPHE